MRMPLLYPSCCLPPPRRTRPPPGFKAETPAVQAATDAWIQLAAGGKLADKYLAGRAGGRYGMGGPEARKKKRGKTGGK